MCQGAAESESTVRIRRESCTKPQGVQNHSSSGSEFLKPFVASTETTMQKRKFAKLTGKKGQKLNKARYSLDMQTSKDKQREEDLFGNVSVVACTSQ